MGRIFAIGLDEKQNVTRRCGFGAKMSEGLTLVSCAVFSFSAVEAPLHRHKPAHCYLLVGVATVRLTVWVLMVS